MLDLHIDSDGVCNSRELYTSQLMFSQIQSTRHTIAHTTRESFQVSFRATTNLLITTVTTAKHIVVIAIHATRFTTGPRLVGETRGTRLAS